MTTALIVSTYRRPRALDRVLHHITQQSVSPDEVLIADDGSGPETALCIERWKKYIPLHHIWQEDRGFNLSASRNNALRVCRSEYIIMIDGDLLLHPEYIRDVLSFARPGQWLQGSRVLLSERYTDEIINHKKLLPPLNYARVSNVLNALRSPWIHRLGIRSSEGYRDVKGCAMSFWRSDIERINGYDEEYTGWGREDNDLAYRLQAAGVRRYNLKGLAIAYHLWHAPSDGQSPNDARLLRRIEQGGFWAEQGLLKR